MKQPIIQFCVIFVEYALLLFLVGCGQNDKSAVSTRKETPTFERLASAVRPITRDLHSPNESVRRQTMVSLIELSQDQSKYDSSLLPVFLFGVWGFSLDQESADSESLSEFSKLVNGTAAWIGTDLDQDVKTMLYGISGLPPIYKTRSEFVSLWKKTKTGARATKIQETNTKQ